MRIGLTEIFVDDQDEARNLYTEMLGMRVKTDTSYSDTARWVTVVSPEDPQGTELLLAPMNDAAAAVQAYRRAAGVPAISFRTDDCRRTYEELKAKGAVFLSEPKQMDYGGTDAVIRRRLRKPPQPAPGVGERLAGGKRLNCLRRGPAGPRYGRLSTDHPSEALGALVPLVGERLYLSHGTIGSHLYRIFPTLDITSRGPARLPAPGPLSGWDAHGRRRRHRSGLPRSM